MTRVRLLHRLAATLGFVAGLAAVVGLTANQWIRPFDETVAGVIAAAATILAGYYLARAAPLVALAINPPVQIGDVVHLAEQFNVPDPNRVREYFVVDIALEGVELLELEDSRVVSPEVVNEDRRHDRTIDVGDITKLLRKRVPMTACGASCRRLNRHCLGPSVGGRPAERPRVTRSASAERVGRERGA